jgi:hypothetical protein
MAPLADELQLDTLARAGEEARDAVVAATGSARTPNLKRVNVRSRPMTDMA